MPPVYTPRPYVRQPYSADTRQLGQIYARQGEMLAEAARMRGAASSQFLAGLAQAWNQIQAGEAEKARRADTLALRQQEKDEADAIRKEEQAIRAAERQAAAEERQAGVDRDAAIYAAENTAPGPIDRLTAQVIRKFPGTAARLQLQETLPATVVPGAMGAVRPESSQFDVLNMTPAQERQAQMDAAARAKDAQLAKDREEDNRRQAARDAADAQYRRDSLAAQQGRQSDAEPLMAVIGDDGQPVYLPRSQAAGRRPASNREQGRPVTSGDAGELADFTTALDDIVAVRMALSGNKATGTQAKVGASLWNPITELTGWGTDAKQKQAVIDRVKQVIGKALEGGVLRKEDELKYAKILPTIGDAPEVVTSKLNGLEAAITKRRAVRIDALADAGYDVDRFRQRAPITAMPDLAGLPENTSRTFKSGPFAGQEWALVNGQPMRIK